MRRTSPQISKRSRYKPHKSKRSTAADQSLVKTIAANFARHQSRKGGLATGIWRKAFTGGKTGLNTSSNSSSKPRKKSVRKKLNNHIPTELEACSKDFFKAHNVPLSCETFGPKQVKRDKNITKRPSKSLKTDDFDEDDAVRIKKRVMYLLNRISKEQSLIDAYSAEGWKGQSREKLRPERELQKAKAQILRCQLRIRDAMHELESFGLEGTMKEYIFDSHGRIYHEDIFCAICKRQDVMVNNDIILCDGACDRAFHQRCLRPPLRTDEIPPDDEGWLCSVCDCKLECLDAINAYIGTTYGVHDPWEKIFPEADSCGNDDGNLYPEVEDWPSEDSGDADYVPVAENNRFELGIYDQQISSDESVSLINGYRWGSDSDAKEDISTDEENVVLTDGKRQRKDVDYLKLHEEMFGKATLLEDASEDEEWGPRKELQKQKQSLQKLDSCPGVLGKAVLNESSATRQNKQRKVFLSPDIVEKLRAAFKENPLPSRACKEELSKQLGLSFGKVHVWFKNVRRAALKKGLIQRAKGRYMNLLEPTNSTKGRQKGPSFEKDPQKHHWLLLMNIISSAQLKLETLRSHLQHTQVEEQDSDSLMYVAVPELKERTQI